MMVAMCRALCSAPSINTDHLRYQLDQLHSEAELTRRKANNARFRLIRLSEAAENLGRQAAVSVRKGKEDDARELLFQKKKIMSALEKSKGRVELLDELAAKLNEAISIKEAQLVRNAASDLEIDGYDAEGPVRIVSSSQDDRKTLNEDKKVTFNISDVGEDQKFVADLTCEGNTQSYSEAEQLVPESISCGNEATMFSSFRGPSSHIDFFEDLDQQLNKIENDLVTILELPTIVQDENKPKKSEQSKVQQSRILQNIRDARVRIRKYVQEIARNM